MNRLEHLLTIAMEECAEIQQAVAKSLRFGLGDTGPEGPRTNEQQIQREFNDLLAVVRMLRNSGLELHEDQRLIQAKVSKVEHYLLYSKQRGTLEGEESDDDNPA